MGRLKAISTHALNFIDLYVLVSRVCGLAKRAVFASFENRRQKKQDLLTEVRCTTARGGSLIFS
jgi:hypothetical protein